MDRLAAPPRLMIVSDLDHTMVILPLKSLNSKEKIPLFLIILPRFLLGRSPRSREHLATSIQRSMGIKLPPRFAPRVLDGEIADAVQGAEKGEASIDSRHHDHVGGHRDHLRRGDGRRRGVGAFPRSEVGSECCGRGDV